MSDLNITLNRGCALVLYGPEGAGKTTLARKVAAAAGSFVEMPCSALEGHFIPQLEAEPVTCIMEGLPKGEEALQRLKALITNEHTEVQRKHRQPKTVRTPNFIFCTGDANAVAVGYADRRFMVVSVGGDALQGRHG